ncbi:MAG: flagellar biosynthesis anti-sigma factor FlgM [Spirochaetaceae bacterium]|nr:flagellar biosynthesis anti-sigma factor FlgM [Spirochaetaceae bacterium]
MTIDKLGSINPLQHYNRPEKAAKSAYKNEQDSISVSNEARTMGELYKVAEIVRNTEDIRLDRVEEVKRKMEDPSYINNAIMNAVADKIMSDVFKI